MDSKWMAELVLTSVAMFLGPPYHPRAPQPSFPSPQTRRRRRPISIPIPILFSLVRPTVARPLQPCNLGFDFTIIYVSIFLPSGMTKQAEGGLASFSLWLRCRSVLSIRLYCPMERVPSLPYRSLSILSHKEIFLDPCCPPQIL